MTENRGIGSLFKVKAPVAIKYSILVCYFAKVLKVLEL